MSAGFESDQNGCKASQRKVCGASGRSFACCGFKTPGRCPKSQVDQEQLRVKTNRRMARAQEASANYTAFHIYVGNRGHGIPCISLIYREILLLAIQNIIPILGLIDGLGVDPAPQATVEGALAAKTFAAEFFTSWVGSACPGKKKVSNSYKSSRSAQGNQYLWRLLNQSANAEVKKKGRHLQLLFRRLPPRLEYEATVWAIAHQLCRMVRKTFHERVRFPEQDIEFEPEVPVSRAENLVIRLRKLGCNVEITATDTAST